MVHNMLRTDTKIWELNDCGDISSAGILHYTSLDNGIEREITTIQQWKLEDIGTVLHIMHGVIVTRRRLFLKIKLQRSQ